MDRIIVRMVNVENWPITMEEITTLLSSSSSVTSSTSSSSSASSSSSSTTITTSHASLLSVHVTSTISQSSDAFSSTPLLPPWEYVKEVPRILRYKRLIDVKRALAARLLLISTIHEEIRITNLSESKLQSQTDIDSLSKSTSIGSLSLETKEKMKQLQDEASRMPLTPLPWNSICFSRTKENKPYWVRPTETKTYYVCNSKIVDTDGFNVNATHHGDWVACVHHHKYLVGIDVMRFDAPKDSIEAFFTRMKKQFTDKEWATINSDKEPLKQFYRHWSLKEAYIKAIGIGLGFDLQRACFFFPDDKDDSIALVEIDGRVNHNWRFYVKPVDAMHCVAVAIGPQSEAVSPITNISSESHGEVKYEDVDFDEKVEFEIIVLTGEQLLKEKKKI